MILPFVPFLVFLLRPTLVYFDLPPEPRAYIFARIIGDCLWCAGIVYFEPAACVAVLLMRMLGIDCDDESVRWFFYFPCCVLYASAISLAVFLVERRAVRRASHVGSLHAKD
jgi:hypothetical protein